MNRTAYLQLEAIGDLSVDQLWTATGFVRCEDCRHLMRTETLETLPAHRCSDLQMLRRATIEETTR